MNPPSDTALFFGRLHVLLVHLPITLILLVALLEWLARSRKFSQANANVGVILALAVPVAVLSVICGWFLSWSGSYDTGLLRWHRWTGVATASLCILTGLMYSLNLKKPYRLCLGSSVLLLITASHFGGSLTHGRDYLMRYAPEPFRTWVGSGASANTASVSAEEPPKREVFSTLIRPILQSNCVGCHGSEKTKGGLRLDSFEAMLKGGENGPAVIPGKATDSLLLKRIQLPIASDDHMPPEGKPQPSTDDIALLQWWIGAGAPTNKPAAQLNPPPEIGKLLAARLEVTGAAMTLKRLPRPMTAEKVAPLASKIADELGIVITPIAQGEPWLQCNASVRGTNFGDQQLSSLGPLRLSVRWLDLGGTAVTDRSLPLIAGMANLTRLHLERTSITDTGLKALASLEDLEYLNLYGTGTSDAALENLKGLARLKQIYLWETKVSSAAATNFANHKIDTAQIERWQKEIEQLKTRIQQARFLIDTGVQPTVNATNSSSATNAPVATNETDRATTAALDSAR